MAEGILKSKVDSTLVHVDSAGTGRYHLGKPPDVRSIKVAEKYGIHIENQRCRQFTKQDFLDFNVIYAMDNDNFKTLVGMAEYPHEVSKVKLLLEEVDLGLKEVPDPYYDGMEKFDEVFQLIDAACSGIAENLNHNQ